MDGYTNFHQNIEVKLTVNISIYTNPPLVRFVIKYLITKPRNLMNLDLGS